MKKITSYFFLLFLTTANLLFAQTAQELHTTANSFMQQGDFSNALLVLNRASKMEPSNINITKDLALTYYLQKDNNKALETIKPLLERDDADDQIYQVAANIYKQLDLLKDCEKLYRKALKKFPDSGPLYNDLGELLWIQKDFTAIKYWEKGIEAEPSFSKNYYNATKYYCLTTDKIWSLLYGEIFINMEPLGKSTPEIKNILLEGYKKLFADADLLKVNTEKNKFADAFLQTMNKQSSIAAAGINTETLMMIRTRFILDWYQDYGAAFPFRLFEFQRQLLQEGTFEAYNQWVFGTVQNLAAYQNWVTIHVLEYNEFSKFQKGRIFKISTGQYYHKE